MRFPSVTASYACSPKKPLRPWRNEFSKQGALLSKPAVAPGQGEGAELPQESPERRTASRLFGQPAFISEVWGKGRPYDFAFKGVIWGTSLQAVWQDPPRGAGGRKSTGWRTAATLGPAPVVALQATPAFHPEMHAHDRASA